MIKIQNDYIAVLPLNEKKGIIETEVHNTRKCLVVSTGPGYTDDDGNTSVPIVSPGDIAYVQLLNLKKASIVRDDGGTYMLIKQHEILCWESADVK